MSIAAVPSYLGRDFNGASPGMRFGMYLAAWEGANWAKTKNQPLAGAKRLTDNDRKMMQALCGRQNLLFGTVQAAAGLCLDAKAIAPFTTGLGSEHPLENGFAFLNPYGLPYLPGSGVKGVLRQAARELASGDWGNAHGWSTVLLPSADGSGVESKVLSMLDVLFGRETSSGDTEHLRGVLSFWDVIPSIAPKDPKKPDEIHLHVEIMTPHQGHYYQQGGTPHECGTPIPIPFLTVPPGSAFSFHVVCDLARLRRLAPELAQDDQWKHLLTTAFEHAFEWLGFGAKTAVGYGAMAQRSDEAVAASRAAAEADRLRCDWVDEAVRELASKNRAPESDTLRSKGLAEMWAALTDADLKTRALADIRARWTKEGWWDNPQGGSAKKAKAIYERGS